MLVVKTIRHTARCHGLLDYRLVTGGFLTVTLPGVPETRGTLFSLVIGIIALSGFHLLQRNRVRA